MSTFSFGVNASPYDLLPVNRTVLSLTLYSVSFAITCGRFYIRYVRRQRYRLRYDDLFNGLGLLTLTAYNVINQLIESVLFTQNNYWNPLGGSSELEHFSLIVSLLAWTTLYLVKASFLALCWSVFNISTKFRRAWWTVTTYTFVTFWPIILSPLWQCGDPSKYGNAFYCLAQSGLANTVNIIIFSFALHVSSDCFILALPMFMIRRLHMSNAQKLSIIGLFMLIIIDIVMGILRNAAYLSTFDDAEMLSGSLFGERVAEIMSICEPSVAVIVCALPVYRVLLPSSTKRRHRQMQRQQSPPKARENVPRISTFAFEIETIPQTEHETTSIV